MIADLPSLLKFNQHYWHQMGQALYGSIETAFNEFLNDVERLPGCGNELKASLRKELTIAQTDAYEACFIQHRNDVNVIKLVNGRFICPDEISKLVKIMEERY